MANPFIPPGKERRGSRFRKTFPTVSSAALEEESNPSGILDCNSGALNHYTTVAALKICRNITFHKPPNIANYNSGPQGCGKKKKHFSQAFRVKDGYAKPDVLISHEERGQPMSLALSRARAVIAAHANWPAITGGVGRRGQEGTVLAGSDRLADPPSCLLARRGKGGCGGGGVFVPYPGVCVHGPTRSRRAQGGVGLRQRSLESSRWSQGAPGGLGRVIGAIIDSPRPPQKCLYGLATYNVFVSRN